MIPGYACVLRSKPQLRQKSIALLPALYLTTKHRSAQSQGCSGLDHECSDNKKGKMVVL